MIFIDLFLSILVVFILLAFVIYIIKSHYGNFEYPHVVIDELYPDANVWIESLANPEQEIKLRFDTALRDWDYEFKEYIDSRIFFKKSVSRMYYAMREDVKKPSYQMFIFNSSSYSLSEMFSLVETSKKVAAEHERRKQVYKQYSCLVKKYSQRYAFMQMLESDFSVTANADNLRGRLQVRCNSINQYNNFKFNKYFLEYLKEHPSYVYAAKTYYQVYEKYAQSNQPPLIQSLPNTKCDISFLRRIEQSMCDEIYNKWFEDKDLFTIIASYSSPGGRNHYPPKSMSFGIEGIMQNCRKLIVNSGVRKRTVTDAQRQRILRRDNFTCRLCGAKGPGAGGAAELEVDHIKPFSKGGSDKDSNLWTLCKACNRGKSNMYDDSNIAIMR